MLLRMMNPTMLVMRRQLILMLILLVAARQMTMMMPLTCPCSKASLPGPFLPADLLVFKCFHQRAAPCKRRLWLFSSLFNKCV